MSSEDVNPKEFKKLIDASPLFSSIDPMYDDLWGTLMAGRDAILYLQAQKLKELHEGNNLEPAPAIVMRTKNKPDLNVLNKDPPVGDLSYLGYLKVQEGLNFELEPNIANREPLVEVLGNESGIENPSVARNRRGDQNLEDFDLQSSVPDVVEVKVETRRMTRSNSKARGVGSNSRAQPVEKVKRKAKSDASGLKRINCVCTQTTDLDSVSPLKQLKLKPKECFAKEFTLQLPEENVHTLKKMKIVHIEGSEVVSSLESPRNVQSFSVHVQTKKAKIQTAAVLDSLPVFSPRVTRSKVAKVRTGANTASGKVKKAGKGMDHAHQFGAGSSVLIATASRKNTNRAKRSVIFGDSILKITEMSPANNYDIFHLCSDDDTDDDENPRKRVPFWASGEVFRGDLVNCYRKSSSCQDRKGVFPPKTFPEIDLTAVFKGNRKCLTKRSSSVYWK